MKKKIKIEFLTGDDYVNDVSLQLSRILSGFPKRVNIVNELMVAIQEICDNIFEYAYQETKGKSIEFEIKIENNNLEVLICDYGVDQDFVIKKEFVFDKDNIKSLPEGGMGLYLVFKMSDSLEYYRIDNKNYFKISKRV